MTHLRISDAYGYHSWLTYAKRFRSAEVAANLNPPPIVGDVVEAYKTISTIKFITNVAGYIPLIGTIVGIARHIFWSYTQKTLSEGNDLDRARAVVFQPFIRGEQIRGTLELLSIGIVNLPFDIYCTFRELN